MRRPWIKIETCTPDKPEICNIATQLRMDEDTVMGKLIRLWSWAELNRIEPNDLGVTKEFIDKLVGRKGFALALMQAGWLVEAEGKLKFPNFKRHNSPVAQNKALTAKRVARHRLRKSQNNDKIAEKSLPEKAPKALQMEQNPAEETDVPRVINEVEPLKLSEVILIETAQEPVSAVTVEFEPPTVIEEPEMSPAAVAEILAEAVPLEEPAPRKRRTKAAPDTSDQPLLF